MVKLGYNHWACLFMVHFGWNRFLLDIGSDSIFLSNNIGLSSDSGSITLGGINELCIFLLGCGTTLVSPLVI
jgi:hypothetical protein